MNQDPLLERRSPLGIPYALSDTRRFLFLHAFGLRAARLSLEKKKTMSDWLPSDFPETAELSWFAEHLTGESFVLTTWPGCSSNDQRLKLSRKTDSRKHTYEPWQGCRRKGQFPSVLASSGKNFSC